MFGDDLLRESVLRIDQLELHEQAFLQIARADSGRIEFLDHGEGFFDVFHGIVAGLREFIEGGGQIAVFIEVADDAFGDFADRLGADADAQLPGQMVGETCAGGKKFVERGAFDVFVFAAARRVPRRCPDTG